MVLHPEIVKEAQKQLDAVTGGDRLPTFDDQGSLPYISCILKECLRLAENRYHRLGSLTTAQVGSSVSSWISAPRDGRR